MADNYIERQQEQYEARKAAWKQAQKYGKKKLTAVRPAESKSHTSTVSKPEDSKRRVFITGGAVLSQHRNTSERVLRHIANAYRLIYQGNFSVQDAVQKIVDQVPMSEEIENIVNFVKASERGIVK